jgi:hypothetical protein
MAEKRDTVARVIDMEDLRKTFKYEDGKLFRFWRGMYWREVDIRKPNDHGYAVVNYNGRPAFAHRIIYALVHDGIDPNLVIDHKQGDTLDNDPNEIRLVPHRTNSGNTVAHRDGKLVGTHFHKHSGTWHGAITLDGENIKLGSFGTEQEAHDAYMRALRLYEEGKKNEVGAERALERKAKGRLKGTCPHKDKWTAHIKPRDAVRKKHLGVYDTEQEAHEAFLVAEKMRDEGTLDQWVSPQVEKQRNSQIPKGAWFDKKKGKWLSHINIKRKSKFLGYFETAEEAGEAYRKFVETMDK